MKRRLPELLQLSDAEAGGSSIDGDNHQGSEKKRFSGREDDRPGLLLLSDAEAGGSSTDGDNHQELELETKHKIFLSHSGFQKDFTEQLCVDLERLHYYPFFDKRPDSLPKGRKFPELIFRAAQQCQVAVLILSEEFFTCTKWPMLELEAFVEAQKRNNENIAILPVYFGLSLDECTKNEVKRTHWVSVWRKWAEIDKRINIEKWEEAFRVLGPSNGIEYVKSLGEVRLRKQIVDAVRCLVKPEITWSVGQIEGRTRICKATIEKFAGTQRSSVYGVRVVGIHGVGGVGKTTLCKLLCDELSTKYEGNVCHAEMGMKSPLELQKQVLRNLTDVNHESLTNLTPDMITNLLIQRCYQQQVFLALDNVWPETIDEAKVYLRAGFCHESVVLVTARSIDLLSRLHIDKSNCMEMPELEEEDAKRLFLHHATSGVQLSTEHDEEDILYCVRQCKFEKGGNMGEHFHPLALKVLGARLGSLGLDPKVWVENLLEGDKFNQFGERENLLFSVLRRGYDSLLEEDQLLFMDSVLFHPAQYSNMEFNTMRSINRYMKCPVDIYEWLSIVHGTKVGQIMIRLQGLKAKSLLEDIGDGFDGVSIHDLYLEFAKLEVKKDNSFSRRWMWYNKEEAYPIVFSKTPPGNCWGNLERVFVRYDYEGIGWKGTMEGIKWQQFSNVVVLELLIGPNEVLDLRGLRCLRSLKVEWKKIKGGIDELGEGKLDGLGESKHLGWLEMRNIHYAPCLKEIACLTTLKVLRLDTNCINCEREALSPPNLDQCIHLQELVLERCGCLKTISDLSQLTSIRKIILDSCDSVKELVGLNPRMHAMRELRLLGCFSLRPVPGLDELVSLQKLDIDSCNDFRQDLNLHKLTNLRRMSIRTNIDRVEFDRVQGFSESMPLEKLNVGGAVELPDLHLLRKLQRLVFFDYSRFLLPRFGNFNALEELRLEFVLELRDLPDMRELVSLKRFTITRAPKLVLHLPVLGDLVTLQELRLERCGTSVGVVELPDLHKLTNLQVLDLSRTLVRSLPSLEGLTQLRILKCSGTHLFKLPDLIGLKSLKSIDISRCCQLTSLGNLANLPALKHISLNGCIKLTSLGNLANLPALDVLYIGSCPLLKSLPDLRSSVRVFRW